jgi:hypothetical protein
MRVGFIDLRPSNDSDKLQGAALLTEPTRQTLAELVGRNPRAARCQLQAPVRPHSGDATLMLPRKSGHPVRSVASC